MRAGAGDTLARCKPAPNTQKYGAGIRSLGSKNGRSVPLLHPELVSNRSQRHGVLLRDVMRHWFACLLAVHDMIIM
jgi:hypothetical protein